MIRFVVLASLALAPAACRTSLEDDKAVDASSSSPACMEATTYQDLTNIQAKIFKTSCIFSGCHNGGATKAGKIDLRTATDAHTNLVGVASVVDTSGGRVLVEPGDVSKSYLMVMLQAIKPADANPPTVDPVTTIGFMPQNTGGQPICQEKRDAIARWITAGAQNN